MIAALAKRLGDLDGAEEAAAEAFATAVDRWPALATNSLRVKAFG
ncbi:hypothetical protein C8E97_4239 [Saccharothrix australiensis]|uniref:Uncharacterized protein n=1 Tax=Saccharothrix australiensis TaxID=2072 RepID=A0A495W4J0_9PSEU|nr:hypothetical protein C8E97_4239 [Saccharothrix australiensis]